MYKKILTLISFFLMIIFISCKTEPDLIIITTGNLNGVTTSSEDSNTKLTPLEVVYNIVNKERARLGYQKVLVLSTGDDLFGTFYSDRAFEQDSLSIVLELLKYIEYQGIALGNNDLKYGMENLQFCIKGKNYNLIGSNIIPNKNLLTKKVMKYGNRTIEIIASIDASACGYLGLNNNCIGYHILPDIGICMDLINRSNSSIEIVLAHTISPNLMYNNIKKWNNENNFKSEQNKSKFDWPFTIVVEGNLFQPKTEHLILNESNVAFLPGVYTSPTINNGGQIGYFEIYFNDSNDPQKGIKKINDSIIYVDQYEMIPDVGFKNKIKTLTYKYENLANKLVTEAEFINFPKIENLANENPNQQLVADAMKRVTGCDLAIINSPAVRKNFPRKLSNKELYTILPFPNRIVTLELTGKEVKSLFLSNGSSFHHATIIPSANITQIINQTNIFNSSELYFDKEKINDNSLFKVAMTDFLFQGGDGVKISGFSPNDYAINLGRNFEISKSNLRDIIINDSKNQKRYIPYSNFRVHRIGNLSINKKTNDLLYIGYQLEIAGEHTQANQYYLQAYLIEPKNIVSKYYLVKNLINILIDKKTNTENIIEIWNIQNLLEVLMPNMILGNNPELDLLLELTFSDSIDQLPNHNIPIFPINDITTFDYLYLAEQLICRAAVTDNDSSFNRDIIWAKYISKLVQKEVKNNHSFELFNHWTKYINLAAEYCLDIRNKRDPKNNLKKLLNNVIPPPTYIGEALSLLRVYFYEKSSNDQSIWVKSVEDKIERVLKLNPRDPLAVINKCKKTN